MNINFIGYSDSDSEHFKSAPSVAPNITDISRTSPTTIMVSWKSLTLSNARGFLTSYVVEYYPLIIGNKRQSLDVMRMDVSALLSSTIVVNLDENLDYIMQVSASTSAGRGVVSSPQVARTFQSSLPRDNTGAIVGGVVAVVLILAVACTVSILAVAIVRRHGQRQDNNNTER